MRRRIPRMTCFLLGLCSALLLGVSLAGAQTGGGYDLSWWTMDGGGGALGGAGSLGAYTLAGTMAQPDAAALTALFDDERDHIRVEPEEAARVLRALTLAMTHPLLTSEPVPASDIVAVVLRGIDALPVVDLAHRGEHRREQPDLRLPVRTALTKRPFPLHPSSSLLYGGGGQIFQGGRGCRTFKGGQENFSSGVGWGGWGGGGKESKMGFSSDNLAFFLGHFFLIIVCRYHHSRIHSISSKVVIDIINVLHSEFC